MKWTARDVMWQGLGAMSYHYETQPLPTWTSWYAHWLPRGMQTASTVGVFVMEAFIPVLYFLPRRLRLIGFWATVIFQCVIMATGNYKFLRRIPVDPMTGTKDWGLRSMQDDPDSTSWGGQNVFDVFTRGTGKALDGTNYTDW